MRKGETTRRERLRQGADAGVEIVGTARDALAKGEAISLRAIAAEMGMAPSALYRYVDSLEHLQRLVGNLVYEEVMAVVVEAGTRYADPYGKVIAGLVAFRRWGLSHRAEYQLLFASGGSGLGLGAQQPEDLADFPGPVAFGGYFMALVEAARADGALPPPPAFETLSPRAQHAMKQQHKMWGGDPRFPDFSLGGWWLQYVSWARIVGLVTMEVTDQIPPALVATGALFEEAVTGFTQQYVDPALPRLRALLEAELGRGET